jgi:hypothetical protein
MLGSFEHRRWFKYRHAFNVNEGGVKFNSRQYIWNEIQGVKRISSAYGRLIFKDKIKGVRPL